MTDFTPARLTESRAVAELLSGSTFAATLDDYSNVGRVAFYPLTDELMCSRMRVAAFFENLPETVLALIDALEAKTAEADYWQNSWNREDGYRIDAERERDKALAEVERITESRNEWASRMMELASETQRAGRAEAALERVRAARAGYPECDKYDDDSPVKCGWMRTVQSIDAVLEALERADDE